MNNVAPSPSEDDDENKNDTPSAEETEAFPVMLVVGIAGGVIIACGVGIGGVIVMKNKTKKEVAATSVAPMPVSYAQPAKNPSAIRNWA